MQYVSCLFLFLIVSHGAQEIFKLLPHTFVDPSRLPELFAQVSFEQLFGRRNHLITFFKEQVKMNRKI
jgi:hypothetical protein